VTTATTEIPGRSKLERLEEQQRRLAEREHELAGILAESPAREDEFRLEHFARHPGSLPDANSAPVRERRRREKAARELEATRENLRAVAQLVEEERAKRRGEMLRRLGRDADAAREKQTDALRVAGEAFRIFALAFRDYQLEVERWEQEREAAAAGLLGGDELAAWRDDPAGGAHLIQPIPVTLEATFELCLEACLDPHLSGWRDPGPGSVRLDDAGQAVRLLPDLRSLAIRPTITLRAPRRHASRR
jgi:hypothetical protein